jgi:hypothetical protein
MSPGHHAHPGDDAGARCLTVVPVVRDQQPDLQPRRLGVQQPTDPLAGGQLPLVMLLLDLGRPAPLLETDGELAVLLGELAQARVVCDGLAGRHSGRSSDQETMYSMIS